MTAVWVVFKADFSFRLDEGFQKSGLSDFFLLLDKMSCCLLVCFFSCYAHHHYVKGCVRIEQVLANTNKKQQ